MDKIQKAFSADITIEEGERAVVAKISTRAVDREGDVLIPQGCRTADYEKNPIVFLNHDYYRLPVGKCAGIRRTDDAVIAKTIFASRPENHPEDEEWVPDTLFDLFKQGILRGFSVGFMPIESRPASTRDKNEYGENCQRVFSKWDMFEYSVAFIPANQEAVAMAVAKGTVSGATAKALGFTECELKSSDEPEEPEMEYCTCPEEGQGPDDKGNCKECGRPMKEMGEDEPEPKTITVTVAPPRPQSLLVVPGVAAPDLKALKRRGIVYA